MESSIIVESVGFEDIDDGEPTTSSCEETCDDDDDSCTEDDCCFVCKVGCAGELYLCTMVSKMAYAQDIPVLPTHIHITHINVIIFHRTYPM